MQLALGDWQIRLEKHFGQLHDGRCAIASDLPIFGIEHGLDANELENLSIAIRAHILHKRPSNGHRLEWIVYASEFGYLFSGDEYWHTFEERTPGWSNNGDRNWLRECFIWFHEKFGGAKPRGRWAQQFSIICWPITHAILPQDLQRQLAHILYELRYSFSSELLESPLMLGKFIAARSWNTTSRFQNLAEDMLLVGQIAAALLFQGDCGTSSLIHLPTLQRIGEDLERERLARDWLRGARRFAKDHVSLQGLMVGRSKLPQNLHDSEKDLEEVVALGIEPRLILRPTNSQRNTWNILIEIPDLSHLLHRFSGLRDVLTGSRCIVAGSSSRPLARGRCLQGAQRVAISRWPQSDEILFRFEQNNSQLEYLLGTECLLRPGPTWLFRIASDGLAYEMRSLRICPGERYIIISKNVIIEKFRFAAPIELLCEGIEGALIELPSALTKEWEEDLRALGLRQSRAIKVWPAGLAAVVWDGEGQGEWLVSERPCLAICSDHPLDAIIVSLGKGDGMSLELTQIIPGKEIFVELPKLPVGLHTVRISARQHEIAEPESLGDLNVIMRIREVRQWSPGISPNGPLIVHIDPPSPTLEQLWESRVNITLEGPNGRMVKCSINLFEKEAKVPTVSRELPPLQLPVSPTAWQNHFERHFKVYGGIEKAYDISRVCELEFKADELGAFKVFCEREFTPVRWAVRHDSEGYIAQLIDNSGDSEQLSVSRYRFETPCSDEKLDSASSYRVPTEGGMYYVQCGNFTSSIILPPKIRGLSSLSCTPHIGNVVYSSEEIRRIIRCAAMWAHARLPGNLFSFRRQREVLLSLTRRVFLIVGRDNWLRAESTPNGGEDKLYNMKRVISARDKGAQLSEALLQEYAFLAIATCDERVYRLKSFAIEFLDMQLILPTNTPSGSTLISLEWLCELALRLASDPANTETWARDRLLYGLDHLMRQPTLALAARFLVLAIDHHLFRDAITGQLYAGWEWL